MENNDLAHINMTKIPIREVKVIALSLARSEENLYKNKLNSRGAKEVNKNIS